MYKKYIIILLLSVQSNYHLFSTSQQELCIDIENSIPCNVYRLGLISSIYSLRKTSYIIMNINITHSCHLFMIIGIHL